MVFMNKLNIILVFSTILFLSCSGGSVYSELFNNLGILFKPPSDIPQEEVNSVKYSTMQVRIGRSPNTLIVLEEVQDDILKWTSSNFVKIYTKEGMIVKVSGLENELEIKDIDKRHPILTKNYPEKGVINLTNFYTFSNPDLHLLPYYLLQWSPISVLPPAQYLPFLGFLPNRPPYFSFSPQLLVLQSRPSLAEASQLHRHLHRRHRACFQRM